MADYVRFYSSAERLADRTAKVDREAWYEPAERAWYWKVIGETERHGPYATVADAVNAAQEKRNGSARP